MQTKLPTTLAFALAALALGPDARAMTLQECLDAVAAGGEPGAVCYNVFTIDAVSVPGPVLTGPAVDPADPAWDAASTTPVNLMWQIRMDANTPAPAIENSFVNLANPDLTTRVLQVRAIHDGANLAYKIVFPDPTKDDSIADVPLFHDGLAVGIPYTDDGAFARCRTDLPGDPQPDLLHMGNACTDPSLPPDPVHPCCPMHLLFWRSDKGEIENIVANGPGTAAETFETDAGLFNTYQAWSAGQWTVILTRPLVDVYWQPPEYYSPAPLFKNMVPLVEGGSYDVVFASWDGTQQERNGYKYIGAWGKLNVQPAPPPSVP